MSLNNSGLRRKRSPCVSRGCAIKSLGGQVALIEKMPADEEVRTLINNQSRVFADVAVFQAAISQCERTCKLTVLNVAVFQAARDEDLNVAVFQAALFQAARRVSGRVSGRPR